MAAILIIAIKFSPVIFVGVIVGLLVAGVLGVVGVSLVVALLAVSAGFRGRPLADLDPGAGHHGPCQPLPENRRAHAADDGGLRVVFVGACLQAIRG